MHKEVLSNSVRAYKMVVLGIWGLLVGITELSPSELLPSERENGFVLQL